jgi:hypothetical protein
MDHVDDFADLPIADLAEQPMQLDAQQHRNQKFLELAQGLRQLPLGKGRQVAKLAQTGQSLPVIAEKVDKPIEEVAPLVKAVKALPAEEQRPFAAFVGQADRSVFDLEQGLQVLHDELAAMLKLVEHNDEIKLQTIAEMRQLFKLAKDVMRDATYLERIKKRHEEDMALVLQHLDRLNPEVAAELFKALEAERAKRKLLGG